ncbi:MAG: hypothetical protein RLZZ28_47 [Bacteroidota bacterium]|jgi:ribonuclease P protein component
MAATYTYHKAEKLKSRKVLNRLFTEGKSFSVFPVKLFYAIDDDNTAAVKAGVGVSARNFKKAVDRNRIKRLLRECYRLNKISLHTSAAAKQKGISLFFLFIGKELPEYTYLLEKMKEVLIKMEEKIDR